MTAGAERGLRILVMVRRLRGRPNGAIAEEVLGECERAALAAAVTLRKELRGRATAIAVGPARREDRVLAMALRAGCDDAVRISDNKLDNLDYLGVAHILAGTANRLGYDLILTGDHSQDERQGAVGPAVAELLEVPHLSGAIDARRDGDGLAVTRRGGGRLLTLRLPTPAVLCVARFPRRAHEDADEPEDEELDRPRRSRETTPPSIEELDLTDLGLEPRELHYRTRLLGATRAVRTPNRVTLLPTAAALAARLRDDHLLE